MSKRLLFSALLPVVIFIACIASPFIITASQAKGGLWQGIRTDNVTTTGKVIAVGPSTVGNGPYVILYSYDVPGFPRNGNPGSFMREQVVGPADLARFRPGMTVSVERSRTSPGSSRIAGFGRGSVYFGDWFQVLKFIAPLLLLPIALRLLVVWRAGKQSS